MLRNVVFAVALVRAPLAAQADEGPPRITVEVGESVEREVGFAIGVRCDDPEIVAAEMRTRDARTNVLVLTGRRVGRTQCRAGTDPSGASRLFAVEVVSPRKARA